MELDSRYELNGQEVSQAADRIAELLKDAEVTEEDLLGVEAETEEAPE